MKHLSSLSLKYIRRQKLRTVLTFFCVTLAVFILNTFSAYSSSIMTTLKNDEIAQNGLWEAEIDPIFQYAADEKRIPDIVANHVAVNDYYFISDNGAYCYTKRNSEGENQYFKLSLDNGAEIHLNKISSLEQSGNRKLLPDGLMIIDYYDYTDWSSDDAVLPLWLKEDYGYEIGDMITLTITPATGVLDETSPQVKNVLDNIHAENAQNEGQLIISDSSEWLKLSISERNEIAVKKQATLLDYMLENYSFNEIHFSDEKTGIPYSVTLRIVGFDNADSMSLIVYGKTGYAFNFGDSYQPVTEDFPDWFESVGCYVRINDNIEFEDGLSMLFDDLGLDSQNFYSYYDKIALHNSLLTLEFKSAEAIVNISPYIFVGLFFAFIAWAISRFVIDNAFEISVQERSVQFASLRVLGASKGQLMTLVFTEAVFYCITAVPIGILTAFGLCKLVFTSLRNVGFTAMEFDVNPIITLIGIFLCLAAIFTSAFTSSMWAARKLSPAEALNYGKPKRRGKESRVRAEKTKQTKKTAQEERKPQYRKSKLKIGAKGFVFRYTLKNIFRTKKRFLVSVISMALGVWMFTMCLLLGLFGYDELYTLMKDTDGYDFKLSCEIDYADEAIEIFSDRELFSKVTVNTTMYYWDVTDANRTLVNSFMPYQLYNGTGILYMHVTYKEEYDQYIAPLTGFSYEEFVQSREGIVTVSPFGDPRELEYDKEGNLLSPILYEDGYKTAQMLGVSGDRTIKFPQNKELKLSGAICSKELTEHQILISPEQAQEYLKISNVRLFAYASIRITVNGTKHYSEAEHIFYDFCDRSNLGIEEYENHYMLYTGMAAFRNAIIKVILVFMLSVWLIGIFSMVGSINTSVLNRQEELKMMRSVGMTKKQLIGTVVLESVLFSAFSAITGTALGVLSSITIMQYLYQSTSKLTGVTIAAILISFAVNLLIAAAAALPGIDSLKRRIK